MVDAIIREWLRQVLGVEAARSRYGDEAFRVLIAIFYADDRIVFARSLFKPIGLRTNTTNTKGMTCVSTRIQTKWSHEVYINVRHMAFILLTNGRTVGAEEYPLLRYFLFWLESLV
jgi:hypothetical protein